MMNSVISNSAYEQGKWQTSFVRRFGSRCPLNSESRANSVLPYLSDLTHILTEKVRQCNFRPYINNKNRKQLEVAKNSFPKLHVPVSFNAETNLYSKCKDITLNCGEKEVNLFYSCRVLIPIRFYFGKQILKRGIIPYSEMKSNLQDRNFTNKENMLNIEKITDQENILENKRIKKYKPLVLNCELYMYSSACHKTKEAKISRETVASTCCNSLIAKNIKLPFNCSEFNSNQKIHKKRCRNNLEFKQIFNHSTATVILEENFHSQCEIQERKTKTLKSRYIINNLEVFKRLNFCSSQKKSKELKEYVLDNSRKESSNTYFDISSCTDCFKMLSTKNNDFDSINHQMMNRKIKQISKHSKKRRKRQKKKNSKCSEKVVDLSDKLHSLGKKSEDFGKATEIQNLNVFTNPVFSTKSKILNTNCSDKIKKEMLSENNCGESNNENVPFSDISVQDEKKCDSLQNSTLAFILDIRELSSDSEDVDSECSDILCDSFFNSTSLLTGFYKSASSSSCLSRSIFTDAAELFDCPDTGYHQKQNQCVASQEIYSHWNNLDEINKQWNALVADVDVKMRVSSKVTFAPGNKLTTVFPIEMWDRKGPWEQYALDRCRFKNRINELEKLISPYLSTSHRTKVFQRLQPCDK